MLSKLLLCYSKSKSKLNVISQNLAKKIRDRITRKKDKQKNLSNLYNTTYGRITFTVFKINVFVENRL